MRRILLVVFMVVLAVSVVAYGNAWAGATVKVTREENKPDPVEVKVGEEVAFVNATVAGTRTCRSRAMMPSNSTSATAAA